MSAAEISHAIQEIGFLVAFRESTLVYPVIISTHLACIALFGGMILVTDLRLLGLAMTEMTITNLINSLRIWKIIGLVIMVTCGLLLATSEMDKYYANPYFQIKIAMILLVGVHWVLFRRSVYANTAALDQSPTLPGVAKLAGLTSIIIWVSIFSLGRWIAYYEPPERRPGGALNPRTTIQNVEPGVIAEAAGKQNGRADMVANPSPADASQANLTPGAGGDLLLSWVDKGKDGAYTLRYSVRHSGAWSESRTIAANRIFFHHPAEVPEIIPLSDGTLVAHWIESLEGNDDAEFVMVSDSRDGTKWSKPLMAHKDHSGVQHGLASIVASGDHEASILWLEALRGEDNPVALKRTVLAFDGGEPKVTREESLAPDVCGCCPTSVVRTSKGLLVAYRDHTKNDIRDIAVTRFENGKWTPGKIIAADNWEINACPTNAASATISGDNVTISWYTAAGDMPRVEAAVSSDGGVTFGKTLLVSTGQAYGYTSASADTNGAWLSWLERGSASGAAVLARYVKPTGELGPVTKVAEGTRQALGYPRLTRSGDETWITWNSPASAQTGRLVH